MPAPEQHLPGAGGLPFPTPPRSGLPSAQVHTDSWGCREPGSQRRDPGASAAARSPRHRCLELRLLGPLENIRVLLQIHLKLEILSTAAMEMILWGLCG